MRIGVPRGVCVVLHGAVVSPIVRFFPAWVTVGALAALAYPPAFTWFLSFGLITPGLQLIMLAMGLTLELTDFGRVARAPAQIGWGVLLQYSVMPTVGWVAGYLFALPSPLAVGLVLVCCCPGGTASNVIAYLAKADVALSVSMTAASTVLAVACTPLLTAWFAGSRVEVDARDLVVSTAEVVLLPVALGVVLRRRLPGFTSKVVPVAPAAAVIAIVLIVAAILGSQRAAILDVGLRLLGAVVTTHLAGFLVGYVLGGLVATSGTAARTISIEVGMQNSGLGTVLAQAHFANPLTAIPSALSAVVHSIVGSAVAAWWSRHPADGVSTTLEP